MQDPNLYTKYLHQPPPLMGGYGSTNKIIVSY